jgi:Pyruvate/2-oxoacid:ferredoxin oxidoreductase delta subunit
VLVDGEVFAGFDYELCKGCELCAEMCPTDAIEMVPEDSDVD